MNNRIKEIRIALTLNQSDFAKRIGIGQAALSAQEKGIRNITDRTVSQICQEFNVNEDWLRTGEGEMFVQTATFSLDEYAQKKQLTELELDIIKSYMDLNKDVRQAILATAQQLFAKHAETAVTIEENNDEVDIEAEVEKELDIIRQELLDEKKAQMLSASTEQKGQKKSG